MISTLEEIFGFITLTYYFAIFIKGNYYDSSNTASYVTFIEEICSLWVAKDGHCLLLTVYINISLTAVFCLLK